MAWSCAARSRPRNYLRMHYMHAQVIASRGLFGCTDPGARGPGAFASGRQAESPHTAYATASLLWFKAVPSMFDSVSQAEW